MTSMSHWTPEQWGVFGVTIAAGVAAAVLLYVARSAVIGWTAPAPLRRAALTSTPRPTIMRAEQRQALAARHAPGWAIEAGYIEPTRQVPVIVGADGTWTDPALLADFTDPGIGALSSIQQVSVDPTLRTAAEIEAEERAWVGAYADLSGMMPETAAAAEAMRVNLEPAMRKVRLWRVRGEGGPARQRLNDWRMDTPTGEYRILTTADLAPYAHALLAS